MDYSGLAILVSGGASGLGAAVVERLAEGGGKLGILDIQSDLGEALAQRVGGYFAYCDVASGDSAVQALRACGAYLGVPRILVNCAGIGTPAKILNRHGEAGDLDSFRRVLDINLVGSFNLLRLAAAEMAAANALADGERGVVILTASVAAYEGQIGQVAYAASKGGIVGLTLPAARELSAHGIRVASIAPGVFDTPIFEQIPPQVKQNLQTQVPFPKRLGHASEYAEMVESIIRNRYINGCTLRLDGGIRLP